MGWEIPGGGGKGAGMRRDRFDGCMAIQLPPPHPLKRPLGVLEGDGRERKGGAFLVLGVQREGGCEEGRVDLLDGSYDVQEPEPEDWNKKGEKGGGNKWGFGGWGLGGREEIRRGSGGMGRERGVDKGSVRRKGGRVEFKRA